MGWISAFVSCDLALSPGRSRQDLASFHILKKQKEEVVQGREGPW